MDSTSIQEQDSSVIPTSLFLLSSLLLVSATSENNSHKEGEGVGEEGEGNAGVGEGVGNAGHVGDVGKKVQNLHVTFDTIPNPNPNPISPISKNPAQGQSPAQSPSTGQSLEEDKYSNLIAAITQHYMRTYKDTSLRLESLDTIFKHNVNNLEKLNTHLQDFGININEATNICINFDDSKKKTQKKAINITSKDPKKLTAKLEKLKKLYRDVSILKTIDKDIDNITTIHELKNLLKTYNIHLLPNEICIKRNTDQDEDAANEAAANEEDDRAEAIAAVEASKEVEAEEAQTAEEVANKAAERAKANEAKEAAERAKANKAEEAAKTIQRRTRRRISSYIPGAPLRRVMRANPRNPD